MAAVHKFTVFAVVVFGGIIFSAALDALLFSDVPDPTLALQEEVAEQFSVLPYAIGFFVFYAFVMIVVFEASFKAHAVVAGACLAYIAKLYFWG